METFTAVSEAEATLPCSDACNHVQPSTGTSSGLPVWAWGKGGHWQSRSLLVCVCVLSWWKPGDLGDLNFHAYHPISAATTLTFFDEHWKDALWFQAFMVDSFTLQGIRQLSLSPGEDEAWKKPPHLGRPDEMPDFMEEDSEDKSSSLSGQPDFNE